jgi:hypothetical protein
MRLCDRVLTYEGDVEVIQGWIGSCSTAASQPRRLWAHALVLREVQTVQEREGIRSNFISRSSKQKSLSLSLLLHRLMNIYCIARLP